MVNNITKTIKELKIRVRNNVEKINRNQEAIKHLLRQSDADAYAGQYEVYYTENQKLLTENNDLINVQLTLVNFLEKYKETAVLSANIPLIDIYSITDIHEVFSLTIKGTVPFDANHPQYNNPAFIERLIVYYKSIEDYEKCQELIRLKEQLV